MCQRKTGMASLSLNFESLTSYQLLLFWIWWNSPWVASPTAGMGTQLWWRTLREDGPSSSFRGYVQCSVLGSKELPAGFWMSCLLGSYYPGHVMSLPVLLPQSILCWSIHTNFQNCENSKISVIMYSSSWILLDCLWCFEFVIPVDVGEIIHQLMVWCWDLR